MVKKFEYLEKLKSSKTKAITISIEESLIEDIENISEELQVSRNRIISEALEKFSDDYYQFENPGYYFINVSSEYTQVMNGHMHMLQGNKIAVFEEDSMFDEIEIGDYVFIWMNGYGIIGAGEVISDINKSNYSMVEFEDTFKAVEEWYANIDYDKKAIKSEVNDIDKNKVLTYEELVDLIENLKENASDIYRRYKYYERRGKQLADNLEQGTAVFGISAKIGAAIKEKYIGN